jgi:hypothetical protein
MPDSGRIAALESALKDSDALIVEAQQILSRGLEPDRSAKDTVSELLGLLDGPGQGHVQEAARAALAR